MIKPTDIAVIAITATYSIIGVPIMAVVWSLGGKKPFYHLRKMFERITGV